MRPVLIIGLAVLLIPLCGVVSLVIWKKKQNHKRAVAFVESVTEVRLTSGAKEALHLLRHEPAEIPPALQPKIKQLREELIAETGDLAQLNALIHSDPEVLEENEDLALLRCRQYLVDGQPEKAEKLLHAWEAKTQRKEDWFFISVAAQAAGKNPEEAWKFEIRNSKFEFSKNGKVELHEAVFAAALGKDDEAWTRLTEAYAKNPRDWELRLFRGNFLEKQGQLQEAQREYVAALLINPENLLARDRLADFYLRYGRIGSAIKTLQEVPGGKLPAYLWTRLNFWSRVAHQVKMPEMEPGGVSSAYARLLREIPADQFWDETAETRSKKLPKIPEHSAQVFWLELIDLIEKGKKSEAAEHLLAPPALAKRQQPQLLESLNFLLKLQLKHEAGEVLTHSEITQSQDKHPFFTLLADWKNTHQDPAALRFCHSENAFAAAFMAAGWTRGAVVLAKKETRNSNFEFQNSTPDWFAFGLAKCLLHVEGAAAAAAWLDQRAPTAPELVYLRAEIDLASGKTEEGLARLETIRQSDNPSGEAATTLLILKQLQAGDFAKADQLHLEQPRLAGTQQGAELKARIAICRGDLASAREHFSPWKEISAEAGLFFAKEAFDAGDFAAAEQITLRLAEAMPLNPHLRGNLKAIREGKIRNSNFEFSTGKE